MRAFIFLSCLLFTTAYVTAQFDTTGIYPSLMPGSSVPESEYLFSVPGKNVPDPDQDRFNLLVFFQHGCHACSQFFEDWDNKLPSDMKNKLSVILIAIGSHQQNTSLFEQERNFPAAITYPDTLEESKLLSSFALQAYPTMYLFDNQRKLLSGRIWNAEQLIEFLSRLGR